MVLNMRDSEVGTLDRGRLCVGVLLAAPLIYVRLP